MQVASTIASEYEILFPNAVFAITNWFQFANLSLFSLVQIGCKAQLISHYDRLLIVTLLPLSIIGLCVLVIVRHVVCACVCVCVWAGVGGQDVGHHCFV